MLKQLARLTQMVRGLNQKHKNLRDSLNNLMTEIEKVESAYKSAPTKTTIGKVSSIDEELYGVPVLEVNNTRVEALKRVSEKTGKEVAQSTANVGPNINFTNYIKRICGNIYSWGKFCLFF